jgi:hypothetical protein
LTAVLSMRFTFSTHAYGGYISIDGGQPYIAAGAIRAAIYNTSLSVGSLKDTVSRMYIIRNVFQDASGL